MLRLITITVLLFSQALICMAQEDTIPRILKMDINAEIDPRMNRYVELALDEARAGDYDAVLIEMDTYGGAVNDAKDIVELILDFEKPIYVFINKDAASAGALISIACDTILMSPGASIGAATVVTQDGVAAPDKYQSYMRSTMRSTAEESGRDPAIAEAMVDEKLEIEGVTKAGEVITFTTSEAITHKFCEAEVKSVEDALHFLGFEEYELDNFTLSGTEKVISVFLNPFISGILILLIIGGLYFELQTPGVGFPILASFVAATLYFIPYYLSGFAANWELVLFGVGVILLVLEVFVIPGFGIAGIAGIICTVGALVLVMLNNDFFDFTYVPTDKIIVAFATALTGLTGGMILIFFGGVKLTQTRAFRRIALVATQEKSEGYTSRFQKEGLLKKEGVAYTVLRPSGKVEIDGSILDAYTRGEYIEKDTKIIVISEEGTSIKVKAVE